jgi:hypothetical protein
MRDGLERALGALATVIRHLDDEDALCGEPSQDRWQGRPYYRAGISEARRLAKTAFERAWEAYVDHGPPEPPLLTDEGWAKLSGQDEERWIADEVDE